ncbi:MAG TPA: LacI family DNA-binding transcriptional regulator [Microlunatus sp.]|nr:LacI family DNA-binding transcriptional regulator [Microlunatus sp.]
MARVTVKTIAEAVGVSASTVSNAYNRPDQLSAELRERILAVADELGYAGPDAAARMLRSGRAEAVGVLLTERLSYAFSDPYAIGFLTALTEVLEQSQTSLVLMPIGYEAQRDLGDHQPDVTAVRQANIDAMTILCIGNLHPATQLAKARGIRIVGTDIDPDPASSWVAIDDVEAGALVGRHLAELGHRRVGVIADTGFPAGTVSTGLAIEDITCTDCRARLRGLAGVLDELVIVSGGHNTVDSGAAAGGALIDSVDRPTAIVGLSDVVALGVLEALRLRGLRAPDDVSVSGFDDVEAASVAGLTTVRQPILEKGRRVGELLLDAEREPRQVLLPIELIVRGSTGVPR